MVIELVIDPDTVLGTSSLTFRMLLNFGMTMTNPPRNPAR